jgi:hypothetical protein
VLLIFDEWLAPLVATCNLVSLVRKNHVAVDVAALDVQAESAEH